MMATPTLSISCTMMNQLQYFCLASSQLTVTVSCPANYMLQLKNLVVYQLQSGNCPSTVTNDTVSGACQRISQTFSTFCSGSVCAYPVNTTGSSTATCSGSFIATALYRCLPVFSLTPALATGSSVTASNNATISNSGVALSSGTDSSTATSRIMSAYVPAGVEAILEIKYFSVSDGCTSSVVVFDINNQTVAQFCTWPSPEVNLGCSSEGRFFFVRYVTGSPPVGAMYTVQFSVPPGFKATGQAANAPIPLTSLIANMTSKPVTSAPPPVSSNPATTAQPPVNVENPTNASNSSSLPAPTGTPTSAGSGWSQSAVIGVIVGCSVAGGVVVLAIIIGICFRLRTGASSAAASAIPKAAEASPQFRSVPPPTTTNYQLDPQSTNNVPFRNVTEFYIDGNSMSKLVLNRKPEPKVFKTVVRV